MTASTSRVRRGRPKIEAATPPITIPDTRSAVNQSTKLWRADNRGARGSFSGAISLFKPNPTFSRHGLLFGQRPLPIQQIDGCHKGRQLSQLGGWRHAPQLLSLRVVHFLPPLSKSHRFCFCHSRFHAEPSIKVKRDWIDAENVEKLTSGAPVLLS